ncbi:MAG: hydrogenase nickel incorporation protein HypB [Cystobacterineae bacterium]|nr:hydrogenase nickel incorporation protein HypB [Cystobacterineae bacterium]
MHEHVHGHGGEEGQEALSHAHAHNHEHSHAHAHEGGDEHMHEHVHGHGGEEGQEALSHAHAHNHEHSHAHAHEGGGEHMHEHVHGHGGEEGQEALNHAHAHNHDSPTAVAQHRAKIIAVETDILAKNRLKAQHNRTLFAKAHVTVLNLLSAPGSGKTTLLVRLLSMLRGRCPLAVVEGDQHTELDARRIRETGVGALQINTGKGCHLDAHQLATALHTLPLPHNGVLFVENVGNLVCPAGFDLGETARVLLLSLTEGEDKPLKYADAFATANAVVLSKADLAPHLDISLPTFKNHLRQTCPKAPVFLLSSKTGEGMDALVDWLWALRTQTLSAESR